MKNLKYNPLTGEFDMSSSPMVKVSYHELKALRDSGVLEPGCQYRITDYNLVIDDTPSENPARSANHVFDIVVTALSNKDLSEDAKAVRNEHDTYFANSNLDAWQIKYCLDNDNSRFAWAYPDKVLGLTANRVFYENVPANDVIYEGEKYLAFVNGEDYLYLKENDLGDPDATLYVYVDDYFSGKIMEPTMITGIAYQKASNPGRGVIYYMKDEFGNEAPYDFKNVMFYIERERERYLFYTFSYEDKQILDASLNANNNTCRHNIIKPYYNRGVQELNFNTFNSTDNYPLIEKNTLDNGCHHNLFSGHFHRNILGCNCHHNRFSGSNQSNIFGNDCNYNTLYPGCENNIFGNGCENNCLAENSCNNVLVNRSNIPYSVLNSYHEGLTELELKYPIRVIQDFPTDGEVRIIPNERLLICQNIPSDLNNVTFHFEPSVGFYELIFSTGAEVSEILISGMRLIRYPIFEARSTYMIKALSTIGNSGGFLGFGICFKVN